MKTVVFGPMSRLKTSGRTGPGFLESRSAHGPPAQGVAAPEQGGQARLEARARSFQPRGEARRRGRSQEAGLGRYPVGETGESEAHRADFTLGSAYYQLFYSGSSVIYEVVAKPA